MMRHRVRPILAVLALAAAGAACSADDPTGPAYSLAGLWVREELYVPFSGDGLVPTAVPDTLSLAADGTGWWSYGRYDVETTPTPRQRRPVAVERRDGALLLEADQCDPMVDQGCFSPTTSGAPSFAAVRAAIAPTPPDTPRRTTMAPSWWRVSRDADVLTLSYWWQPTQTMRFRRVPAPR